MSEVEDVCSFEETAKGYVQVIDDVLYLTGREKIGLHYVKRLLELRAFLNGDFAIKEYSHE